MPGLGAIPPARRGRARDRWGVSSRRARRRCAGHGARCPAPSLRLPEGGPTCKASGIPPWPGGSGSSHAGHWVQGHHRGNLPGGVTTQSRRRCGGCPGTGVHPGSAHRRGGSMIEQRPCIAEIGAGRCAGIGPLGDEVAAERVARCQPLATPASDGQGAPVRFARVRFAASRFARARPPGRACGSGAQLRPQPGHRGAVAAQASPRRALSGEGSVRGQNSERDLPGPAPRPSTEFPAARGGEGMERGAVCPQRRRVHGGQDDVPARPQGV